MRVLYFTAKWCGPCKAMKPIIEKFMETNPGVINKIDVDEDLDAILEYKISSIPTFVVFNAEGDEVNRHSGALNEASLNQLVFG